MAEIKLPDLCSTEKTYIQQMRTTTEAMIQYSTEIQPFIRIWNDRRCVQIITNSWLLSTTCIPHVVYYKFYTEHNIEHTAVWINGSLLICSLCYLSIAIHFLLQCILIPHLTNAQYPLCIPSWNGGLGNKRHLFMGGEWSLNKALNEAPKLKTANAAGRSTAKLLKVKTGSPVRTRLPSTKRPRAEWPYVGSVETSVASENTVD